MPLRVKLLKIAVYILASWPFHSAKSADSLHTESLIRNNISIPTFTGDFAQFDLPYNLCTKLMSLYIISNIISTYFTKKDLSPSLRPSTGPCHQHIVFHNPGEVYKSH